MPTLDELRTALTAEHRQLLTRIADYHLSKGGWPLRQVIHHGFRPDGRAVAREAMDKLGGSIIYEGFDGGEDYRVTLLGIILSERGRAVEDLLVKYLSFVQNAYDANPEPRQLTREEIQSAFELTDEEAELLGKLVFFDNSFPFAGGGALGKEWRAQLPREAEDIPEDVRGYLHAKLLAMYKPGAPTTSPGRERALYGASFGTLSVADVAAAEESDVMQTRDVFIVHGREEGPRESVARFVARLGLNPIILHEQPDQGRTIIEKFEEHSADVRYAIVLLTADDRGGLADAKPSTYRPRARQNVILELGYFLGKLGRRRVSVIYEEAVEIPSDYQGVLYTPLDPGTAWRFKLAREMKAAGFDIDLNLAVWHRTSRKRSTAWRCASASRCAVARARPAGVTSPPKTTAIQN